MKKITRIFDWDDITPGTTFYSPNRIEDWNVVVVIGKIDSNIIAVLEDGRVTRCWPRNCNEQIIEYEGESILFPEEVNHDR